MNTSSQADYSTNAHDHQPVYDQIRDDGPPVAVQVLSIIGFGVFSIVGVSLAFSENWIAGIVVAAIVTGTWASTRTFGGKGFTGRKRAKKVASVAPHIDSKKSSGNASFDAYRADMIARLEQESRDFDDFLIRLREARDASEFDQYLDDRAKSAKSVPSSDAN